MTSKEKEQLKAIKTHCASMEGKNISECKQGLIDLFKIIKSDKDLYNI